jgi:hypothetical protein
VPRRAPRRPSRRLLIRLLAILVLAGIGVGGWRSLQHQRSVSLELGGKVVDQPGQVLSRAERQVAELVRQNHGAEVSSTRCYFATAGSVSAAVLKRARSVAIAARMLCGPVLFVDGDASKPFAAFDLSGTDSGNGRTRLAVAAATDPSPDQEAAGPDNLIRPDRRQPPRVGSLAVPAPPAANADLLSTTTTLGSEIDTASADAQMIGTTSGVRLRDFGFVSRYGAGTAARTAPPGRRLLAFSVTALPGEFASASPSLALEIDGSQRGPLVMSSEHLVAAVPDKAKSVNLVLSDGGHTQRLSLLTGQPDRSNPLLSGRSSRMQTLAIAKPITVKVSAGKKSGLVAGTIQFRSVWLSYWTAGGTQPSAPDRAFLHVTATVKLVGDREAYGAEAGLLSASLPAAAGGDEAGASSAAKNAATNPATQVDDVIEVPADLTSGSLQYSGQLSTAAGTLKVMTPVKVPFDIRA